MVSDRTAKPVLIIGSGIAGLLTALKLSDTGTPAIVMTKSRLADNSSWMAQGGIAAVLPENTTDSLERHVADTLSAGAGLANEAVTRSILSEGYLAIEDLLTLGVPFDRVDGKLAFTKEAAHSTRRILHAGGDATGRSIQDTLINAAQSRPDIQILERYEALDLLMDDGRCIGAIATDADAENPEPIVFHADHTVLATGGLGRLYSQTTNPAIATGDGVALAYRAGARIRDLEFVQFHPTAFWADGQVRFLISEALRGEGAILRNADGVAFAKDFHPDGELAPRDIVTRAISAQLLKDKKPHVWLDITQLPADLIETRFPNILDACLRFGVDIRKDWIPVAPAAHYAMGGVDVDPTGKTSIPGLYGVGEAASSGLHGANRLASNSLLECVVLARRVAAIVAQTPALQTPFPKPALASLPLLKGGEPPIDIARGIQTLRETMWASAGILRNARGLQNGLTILKQLDAEANAAGLFSWIPLGAEYRDMLLTARLIIEAAMHRRESRGAHWRTDYDQLDANIQHSLQEQPYADPDRIALHA